VPSPSTRAGSGSFVVCDNGKGSSVDHPGDEVCAYERSVPPVRSKRDGEAVWCCPRCGGDAHRAALGQVLSTVCTPGGSECWSWAGWPAEAPAAEPEVRHCSVREPGAAYEGRVLERCEAVIGADVLCSACGGGEPVRPGRATKCYAHCQSIDHYGAPLTMSTQVAKWGLVLRAQGLAFQGEVRELESEKLGALVVRVLPKIFGGTDAEKVVGEMMTFVDGLRNDQPGWGVPAKLPYTPPTVTPLSASLRGPRFGADRGDETCSEVDAFDPGEWQGVTISGLAQALRAPRASSWVLTRKEAAVGLERLALEISHAWGELQELREQGDWGEDDGLLPRARALSDAAVCAVISLLAGGVR